MPKRGQTQKQDIFVSVILLADHTTKDIVQSINKTSVLLAKNYRNFEIIVIDNDLALKESVAAVDLLSTVPCIRIIRLSKVVTKDTSVFAGIESAIGDHVVLLVPGYDPVNLIPKFVQKNTSSDLVFGISKVVTRKGFFNRRGAELFYWYNQKYLGISIPAQSTYYMAMNRRAVNALTRSGRHARHVRYLARQVGYKMDSIDYAPNTKVMPERKKFKELCMSAVELTTHYSQHPLRVITWLGVGAAVLNVIYCAYVIATKFIRDDVAQGWTTLSLQIALMFLLVFLILAVLSEYVGQILQESRKDPPYHVMEEHNSTISVADMTRRNIIR